jgi:PAS domain S-box-containing protein
VALGIPLEGPVQGHDEIAGLERTLQQTSRLLRSQAEELEASRAGLEARVEQRTAELTAANEELHRSNQERAAVTGSSPLAIWAVDLEGNVTFWNPAAERVFGWTAAEALGRPLPITAGSGGPEGEDPGAWLARVRAGTPVKGAERSRRRKDGSRVETSLWTAPLRDAAGEVSGAIGIESDMSERRLLEEQFRQSQKLEAVGRLAGGVAHDFNNLLTVITGFSEMLVEEGGASPVGITEAARQIRTAAERASALTSQLLAFSRRQISQPRVIDLNDVVTHALKMLGRLIGEDVNIVARLDSAPVRVKADPGHLDQVLMNLVVNARDAMPGGGTLTIETRNAKLDEDYTGRHLGVEPGTYAMLALSDTGTGMDPETRSHIFEPFFTTKREGKGTGLGLSIVYGIVKQAGGEILVYSEPGHGTTFKIYLPLVETPTEPAMIEAAPAPEDGSETVLVCEDDAVIRGLVRTMLTRCGYRVIEAPTPERAKEIALTGEPIDLLLTDVVMPQMSGFDLVRRLRERQPGLKVLFMSGYTDSRLNGWQLEPGTPFVQKPFTSAELRRKVREALEAQPATN